MKTGDNIEQEHGNWNFGGNVPETFVKHVRKSVPFYDEGHELICYLSDYFCQSDSVCYELGVSTGQLIKKLAEYNRQKPNIRWIGIDREEGMVKKAKEYCGDLPNIELICDNIITYDYEKADMIIGYYCVQFVPERHRQEIFTKIYDRLNWGGALVLFEKVRASDARFQDMMTGLYHDYKIRNGFTAEEILGKAQSLKGTLDPFSTNGNLSLLKRAGFTDIMTIMKYVCFEGFLAIK